MPRAGHVASFGIGALAAAILLTVVNRAADPAPPQPQAVPSIPAEERTIALFETARQSVVAITTEARVLDPWSRRAVEVPRGSGSGFAWDGQGHIVTNSHVIAGASSARVQLADGRILPARLVGAAPEHDLAVLRIDAGGDPPPPLPRGDSEGLRVGQTVLAIGNPFGLDWTLTTGIVSALDREIPTRDGGRIEGVIQTDAAINPGNSGGPLIDGAGRLIGVNTAIFSPSGSSAGIGFAVPVAALDRVVPQLIATGVYRPPVLGVVHDDRVNRMARQSGLEGVLVLAVEPGSPADTAGLRPARRDRLGRIVPGDAILSIDGRSVATSADLRAALDARAPGDAVRLRLRRDRAEIDLTVTLAAPGP